MAAVDRDRRALVDIAAADMCDPVEPLPGTVQARDQHVVAAAAGSDQGSCNAVVGATEMRAREADHIGITLIVDGDFRTVIAAEAEVVVDEIGTENPVPHRIELENEGAGVASGRR